jgi:6-phospho-beta-glucosidase
MKEKLRIGVIGGGSVFTPALIEKLAINTDDTGPVDITLMDINPIRLATVGHFCERLVNNLKKPLSIQYTEKYAEAIKDADFILIQFRQGGIAARIEDEKLGKKYKLPFTETVSVCGFSTYLRTIPQIEKIAELILQLAPNAWVMSFTNPAGQLAESLYYLGVKKVLGVCNISALYKKFIVERIPVHDSDIQINLRGLNHLTFVDKIFVHGKDIYPQVIQRYDDGETKFPFPKELIEDFSFLPSPYLQYYYRQDELVEALQTKEKNRSEIVWDLEQILLEKFSQANEIPSELTKRGGYGYSDIVANVIKDMITDRGTIHYLITRNGSNIPCFSDDSFVEVPVVVNTDRINAVNVEPLPDMVQSLAVTMKHYEQTLMKAALTRNKNLLLQALMIHPLIPSYNIAKALLEDVLEINQNYLPKYKECGYNTCVTDRSLYRS